MKRVTDYFWPLVSLCPKSDPDLLENYPAENRSSRRRFTPSIMSLIRCVYITLHLPHPSSWWEGSWGLSCERGAAVVSVCIGCIGAVVAVGDEAGSQGHADVATCGIVRPHTPLNQHDRLC